MSLYLVKGCQWNLAQIFILWVAIAHKVLKVEGQTEVGCRIIIIIHEFHGDTSLKQNFRAADCHVLG